MAAKDDARAVKLYGQAAAQGHAAAQCSLAIAYKNGEGVARNYHEAERLFRLAAAGGDDDARDWLTVDGVDTSSFPMRY